MASVKNIVVRTSAVLLISVGALGVALADDAPAGAAARDTDGKLMDHSAADGKSMSAMKHVHKTPDAKEADAGKVVKDADGAVMDHSPADGKSMSAMKHKAKKSHAKKEKAETFSRDANAKLMDHSAADGKAMSKMPAAEEPKASPGK